MSKAYVLEEKRYIQISHDGFESLSEALTYMKKMISENCTIDVELNAIKNKRLPAPKYRASVARYLEILFTDENNFPSYKNIDYSDYIGKPRKFDPDSFYEFVDFKEFDRVTHFEDALGFIFVAGEKGMQLAFNGRYSNTLCYFKRYKDNAFFGVEYWKSGRNGLDMRIRKSDKDISARPYGSFYPLLLLDILLKQTEMRRINLKHEEVTNLVEETPENSLEWMMRDALYTKMNSIYDGFILPTRLTFSGENEENENLIEDYISTLNEFGYDVKKDTYKSHTIDYKNHDIYRDINSYYIPPFICKHDLDIILDCIKDSELSENEKEELVKKFKSEAGCHRYSKNDFEESALPQPRNNDWSDRYYALIIYHTLRFSARPLPISPEKKESIQGLAEKYYGVKIDRKKAIPNNAAAMASMGLPIQKVDGKYCFDTSKLLSKDDMDALAKCIAESNIAESEKKRLIKKLDEKFPIGKY